MTNSAFIALRDTISKQVIEYPAKEAEQWLSHPVFGLRLEEVRTAKPEVLSNPFTLDEDGERVPTNEGKAKDSAPSDEPVKDKK